MGAQDWVANLTYFADGASSVDGLIDAITTTIQIPVNFLTVIALSLESKYKRILIFYVECLHVFCTTMVSHQSQITII